MEQDQEVREKAVLARAEAPAEAEGEVLQQAQAGIAYVPTVAKGRPINRGIPVMSNDVLNVEWP
jgi:hypothetical protein